jgi:SAM-dependent methyltransferase
VLPFDRPLALRINEARLEHLASLGLPLTGRRVLEVGAGIGLLTHFFEERGCQVLSTEGRPENIRENLHRHPRREGRVHLADLESRGGHGSLGRFDIVFCYGVLYHLADPAACLDELSAICDDLFLLSSWVHGCDNGQVNQVVENSSARDVSLHGRGCRPARDWLMRELRERFPCCYLTVAQPRYPDYPRVWPSRDGISRAVFVASRAALALPSLTTELLDSQEWL